MTKPTCVCGVSVHKATLIVGILSLVCNFIIFANHTYVLLSGKQDVNSILAEQQTSSATNVNLGQNIYNTLSASGGGVSVFYAVVSFVSAVFSVFLIYGNRTRKPAFYHPFLGLMLLDVAFTAIGIFTIFVLSIVAFTSPSTLGMKSDAGTLFGATSLTMVAVFTLIYVLRLYFFVIVVNRSRKLLIEEKEALGGIGFAKHPAF